MKSLSALTAAWLLIAPLSQSLTTRIVECVLVLCYAAMFGALVWMMLRLGQSPAMARYRWTASWVAALLLSEGALRLTQAASQWVPLGYLEVTLRVAATMVATAAAVYFVMAAPRLAGLLRRIAHPTGDQAERRMNAAIQETEQIAEALAESDTRFRLLVEGIRDYAVYTVDPAGVITTWNRGAERLLGYKEQEILGAHFSRLLTAEENAAGVPEQLIARARECRYTEDEGWRVHADGTRFWARVVKTALLDDCGQLRGFVVIVHDMTLTRNAERQALEQGVRLKALVETTADGVVTIDHMGVIDGFNPACERLFGYPADEVIGRNVKMLMPEPFQSQHDRYLSRYAETGKGGIIGTSGREVRGLRKDGTEFPMDLAVGAFLLDGTWHYSGIVRDLTEKKKLEQDLRESLQNRVRTQERFLSHVSHELRTPLTAIYFFVSNVLDGIFGDLTTDQRDQLQLTLENTKQLKEMVSDLLDITRIDSHKLTISSQPSNPARLVLEVISTCRKNANEAEVKLSSELSGRLPFVWADPSRVRQVLTNLIENAVKFTPPGGTVTVGNEPFQEGDERLCLKVSDTGCGIKPADKERIFDRLAQAQGANEASRKGLGLGLFISRELVMRHGGRIWVESDPGVGSTFFFTLPAFSLQQWCERVLSQSEREPNQITLIAVDLGTHGEGMSGEMLHDCKRTVERCIHPGQDVLLPIAGREQETMPTIFIAARAGTQGVAIIESRITREFSSSLKLEGIQLGITASSVDITQGASREEQTAEVTAQIEKLIDAHLSRKGS
ncbi:PAS domain S-box protein [Silvibacterium sp.]|uniref:PAS domain-containing sensor histidine kinase n=1 Tax=Silvibacterium sp. TaxID=1964179 RepID=UPI0039E2650B